MKVSYLHLELSISPPFCIVILMRLAWFALPYVSWSSGPVRGIDFHKQQPLFVSGGDDYKIKVRV